MTFNEILDELRELTEEFTIESGSYRVEDKGDVRKAVNILNKYYINVDSKHLDYKNKEADGTDYLIEFDTPDNGIGESMRVNESLGEAIEKHDELNPKLWDGQNLKPKVEAKLREIVQKFDDNLKENEVELDVKDICIIGSNANYNYSPDSDVDLHIVADTSVYPDQEDLAMKVYLAYKSLFNNKYDPTINGIEVEIYVEPDAIQANSNGIYSLDNGWLKEPEQVDVPEIDPGHVQELIQPYEERYNELINGDPTVEDVDKLIDDIYLQRQTSIMKDGEFGDGNICFKEFRNRGYLQNLRDLKVELENKEMSLDTFGEGLLETYLYEDTDSLMEDIDVQAGQIYENGPEHTIEILSVDNDRVKYKEKDGIDEFEDEEYAPRMASMLSEYNFKLAESKECNEDITEYPNGLEFSFPDPVSTLEVYLQWEGIIGYDWQIIEAYEDGGYDGLSEYLDEEGIYGYTEHIRDILEGEPAYCSQMEMEDLESICRHSYISIEDAMVESVNEEKKNFNSLGAAKEYVEEHDEEDPTLKDEGDHYEVETQEQQWPSEIGSDYDFPEEDDDEPLILPPDADDEDYEDFDESLKEGYNRLSKVFNTKEEADDFVKFLDPDLEPRIDVFDHEDMDHSVKTWYKVYYWDPVDYHEDEVDESLNEEYRVPDYELNDYKDWLIAVDKNINKDNVDDYASKGVYKYTWRDNRERIKKDLDEGTAFDSMPGYMSPEDIRAFNREKEAKAKAEKDAARAVKAAERKERAKAERARQKRIDQREKVNSLSYDSLADMAGLDEDNNDLTKDELLAVLRSSMSDEDILKMHKKMFEGITEEVGIPGGPYENDDDYILDQNPDYDNGLPDSDDIPFKDNYLDSIEKVDFVDADDDLSEDNDYLGRKRELTNDEQRAYYRGLPKFKVTRDNGKSFTVQSGNFKTVDDVKDYYKFSNIANVELIESDSLQEDVDPLDPKAIALADYEDVDVTEIDDEGDGVYLIGDSLEYFVGTEDEAHARAVEEIKALFDDMGLESFTKNFQDEILRNFIDESEVDAFIESELDYFRNDEPDEDMVNYLENLTDKVEYVKDTLGPDSFSDWAKDKIDLDAMAEEAIKQDGEAHFIAFYDGNEIDLGNGLFAYRMN